MNNSLRRSVIVALSAVLLALPCLVQGQGMPPQARANIHTLLDRHSTLTRKVDLTDSGYISLTESQDPEVITALQDHVQQMAQRLESGLMVRRWDPAFAEYVRHYRDIEHKFDVVEHGLRATVTGRTPAAIEVARNHARVVSEFVAEGWPAHDRSHATVAGRKDGAAPAPAPASSCPADTGGASTRCCGGEPTKASQGCPGADLDAGSRETTAQASCPRCCRAEVTPRAASDPELNL